jgi:hypothetical protein
METVASNQRLETDLSDLLAKLADPCFSVSTLGVNESFHASLDRWRRSAVRSLRLCHGGADTIGPGRYVERGSCICTGEPLTVFNVLVSMKRFATATGSSPLGPGFAPTTTSSSRRDVSLNMDRGRFANATPTSTRSYWSRPGRAQMTNGHR